MTRISRELLHAYLDDALRQTLRKALAERDRGEHTLGAVWRRERLTCPTREQLGSYLLQVLDEGALDYFQFHLETIGCSFCLANLADLQAQLQESGSQARQRRKRFFETSAGLLGTPNE